MPSRGRPQTAGPLTLQAVLLLSNIRRTRSTEIATAGWGLLVVLPFPQCLGITCISISRFRYTSGWLQVPSRFPQPATCFHSTLGHQFPIIPEEKYVGIIHRTWRLLAGPRPSTPNRACRPGGLTIGNSDGLNLNVLQKRMLTKSEAADHCGRSAKRFEIECPVQSSGLQMAMLDGTCAT